MLTLFAFLDFMSLHEEDEVGDISFGLRPLKAPRHRTEHDYTLTYIVDFDERLDDSEPLRVTWRQRLRALLFR